MPASIAPLVGQEITDGAGGNPGQLQLMTDKSGAPIQTTNWTGTYFFGAPGFPGGLACTTYILRAVACLTPDTGSLELFSPPGQNPVVLTYQDIVLLHSLEAAGAVAVSHRAFRWVPDNTLWPSFRTPVRQGAGR
jgi:hypothetical protein